VTKSLMEYVTSLAPGEYTECQIAEVMGKSSAWVAHVQSIGHGAELLWSESTIPARSGTPVSALLIRVDSIKAPAIDVTLLDTIVNSTCPSGYVESTADTRWIVLADSDSASLYVMYRKDGEWILWSYHTLDLTSDRFSRLPDAYKGLRSKKIGFAGCGSLGAKIATSLARSGVGGFVLVDDDVFLPENVVRNDLDGASLGMHKAEALAERLHAVSSQVSVSVRRVLLGGQESSGTTATVLDELATCDLLIDATADAQAFNYVAAVARSALRPMIWAEVYAGGVGGFVGRLRPNIEPPPHQARHQYLQWCDERDVPWQRHDSDYESRGSGEPLVADDADVSTIAAHATKMAIDCLINPTNTMYPHAAYVIGLRAEWIFTEPLQVWPLNFVPNGDWQAKECESKPEDVKYILQLLGNSFDEGRGRT
jgi:molybdopterin/thiamine biosynthesis adenylyltransferase